MRFVIVENTNQVPDTLDWLELDFRVSKSNRWIVEGTYSYDEVMNTARSLVQTNTQKLSDLLEPENRNEATYKELRYLGEALRAYMHFQKYMECRWDDWLIISDGRN